jgi:hypothetical protein
MADARIYEAEGTLEQLNIVSWNGVRQKILEN